MKKILKNTDKILLVCVIIMCTIGLFAVLSASSVTSVFNSINASPYLYFKKQLAYMIISFSLGFLLLFFSMKFIESKTNLLLFLGFVLLIFVLMFGTTVNGTTGWLNLGFASIQPSEFIKLIMILFMGRFFANQNKEITRGAILIFLTVVATALFLIGAEHDTGTALVLTLIIALTFLAIPLKNKTFTKILKFAIPAGVILIFALVYFGVNFLSPYQKERFNIKAPCSRYYEHGTGYQVCNGFIAINNGGLFGVGIGNSTQKYLYLPEAHTDFIFPIIVEETGVIFSTVLILLYLLIIFRIYIIAKTSTNLRNSIIAYGIACYFTVHFIVNIGGVLSIIPLTGVPLLFLSSGGSALLTSILSVFIVLRISAENKMQRNLSKIKSI